MPTPELSIDLACVEARGLALGLRQAWRFRLPTSHLQDFRQAFCGHGLHVAISEQPYRELIGGRLELADADMASCVHFLIVADSTAVAEQCLADEVDNADRDERDEVGAVAQTLAAHRRLGAAYGYPTCCVQAFCDGWLEATQQRHREVSDNALLLLRAHLRSRSHHHLLRVFGGALGSDTPSPLRHLPCRFDCDQSVAMAESLLVDLRTSNPSRHTRYVQGSVGPVWVETDGSTRSTDDPGADVGVSAPPPGPGSAMGDWFPLMLPFGVGYEAEVM